MSSTDPVAVIGAVTYTPTTGDFALYFRPQQEHFNGDSIFACMVAVEGYLAWVARASLSGVGMALLDPNLMTVPGDACHPTWRASGMGVYRMWRDAGYGVGAIVIGLVMQGITLEAAFYLTGVLMFASGAVVSLWMEETHLDFGTHTPPAPATTQEQPVADG